MPTAEAKGRSVALLQQASNARLERALTADLPARGVSTDDYSGGWRNRLGSMHVLRPEAHADDIGGNPLQDREALRQPDDRGNAGRFPARQNGIEGPILDRQL